MADQHDERLRRQRLLILLAAIVAALFIAGNIFNSLGTWRENDAESTQNAAPAVPNAG